MWQETSFTPWAHAAFTLVMWCYLNDEADVSGEGLHSVEAGDEGDGEETLRVHFSPQEEVSLQIVEAKVVLTEKEGQHNTFNHQHKQNKVV